MISAEVQSLADSLKLVMARLRRVQPKLIWAT